MEAKQFDWTIVAVLAVLVLATAELWWHKTPSLQRIAPETYYTLLVGQAGEAADSGDMHRAQELLELAIRKFPRWYWAYQTLGDNLLHARDTNGALYNYEQAVKYCGTSPTNLISVKKQLEERSRIMACISKLREQGGISK